MQYTIPDYYNEFSCIAGACPDTCCAGWQIVIDEKSLHKYKKYSKRSDEFGKRLKDSVDWREGVFYQCGKRCAFLNDENLCDLYKEAGPQMLCDTCRKYPRHVEEYEDLREISLSLSCPVVAKMLIEKQEKVTFLTKEKPMRAEEYEEFDYMLFTQLCDAREVMISILQSREYDIRTRIAMVLSLGHDFQRRVSKGQLFETDELLERYRKEDAIRRFEKRCICFQEKEGTNCEFRSEQLRKVERQETFKNMYGLFDELEVLRDDFPNWRKERFERVMRLCTGEEAVFERCISRQEAVALEQLMVYFLYTYFCGAVYDEQAYGKVKFAVVSTLLIQMLYRGDERTAVRNDAGNAVDFEPQVCAMTEAAYRYAKEVEHSDQNLMKMEQLLLKNKEFGIENLMKAIYRF